MLNFKKIRIFYLLILLSLISSNSLFGYFYNIQEWSNGTQKLFLFSDYHSETEIPLSHREDLVSAAKHMNAFVIIEDMIEKIIEICPGFESHRRDEFLFNENISPLINLTYHCKQHDIPSKNIEFRTYKSNFISHIISMDDILTALIQIKEEIKNYHDGDFLDNFYNQGLFNLTTVDATVAFGFFIASNLRMFFPMTLKDFLENDSVYDSEFDQCLRRSGAFDAGTGIIENEISKKNKKCLIIDLLESLGIESKILHEIYNHQDDSSIFVCAGGGHINNISILLPRLGFNLIRKIGANEDYVFKKPPINYFIIDIKRYFENFHNFNTNTKEYLDVSDPINNFITTLKIFNDDSIWYLTDPLSQEDEHLRLVRLKDCNDRVRYFDSNKKNNNHPNFQILNKIGELIFIVTANLQYNIRPIFENRDNPTNIADRLSIEGDLIDMIYRVDTIISMIDNEPEDRKIHTSNLLDNDLKHMLNVVKFNAQRCLEKFFS